MNKKEALTVVIFGGTGDLAMRKLVPAFSRLIHDKTIKKHSTIIGVARGNYTDASYKNLIKKTISDKKEREHLDEINIKYVKLDFTKINQFEKLKEALSLCEVDSCNRLYYLATGYKFFPTIANGLKKYGLSSKKQRFTRVSFEKPFGNDLKSFRKISKELHDVFKEDQIYRVDHYLGKESVYNIVKLKKNKKFCDLLSNKNVESVNVTIDEKLGVENRMGYYDGVGAIKDMIQSHLLQVISFVLMDCPKKLDVDSIHDEKLKILKCLEIKKSGHLIGQYKSYAKEAKKYGIKNSKTETFVHLVLNCKSKKWDGVDLHLRTGKKLSKKYGKITINFKNKRDKIIIDLQPIQGIKANIGKEKLENEKICITCSFRPNSPESYEVLLKEAIKGNKSLFVRRDETEASWVVVDKLYNLRNKIKFVIYPNYTDPEKVKA